MQLNDVVVTENGPAGEAPLRIEGKTGLAIVSDSFFIGNTGSMYASAVYVTGGEIRLLNTVFRKNAYNGESVGERARDCAGTVAVVNAASAIIINCTFVSNVNTKKYAPGGAIGVCRKSSLRVNASNFEYNTHGAAINYSMELVQ